MEPRTVALYETVAQQYGAARTPVRRDAARAFGASVAGPRVDLGSGAGRYTGDLGRPVIALDAALAMVRATREAAPSCWPVQADLAHLPFRRGTLAGAWASMSYHHLPRAAVPMALADLHHALAVGAPVDLTAVRGTYEGDELPGDDFPGRFFACWTEEPLVDVLTGAGFDVESAGPDGPNIGARARRACSLADTVGADMRLLVCGLNPSLYAADAGVGFARPGNRFWPAARAAGLVTRDRDPRHALAAHGVGMTDLVKRATARSAELSVADYRSGAGRVRRLVEWLQPGAICFVGLEGYRAAVERRAAPGPQPEPFGGRPAYVMPSTSGLNARTSRDELAAHLQAAADLGRAAAAS